MHYLLPFLISTYIIFSFTSCQQDHQLPPDAPNILFIIADDWSYPHASIYGDTVVQTPNFDRIAREGVLFQHAYVSSPSCTPSRAAVLTGQHFWRLEEGANLYGPLRTSFPTYTDILSTAGYKVGYTRKGWGPGSHEDRSHNPAGELFESFDEFLKERDPNTPFCFWFGSQEPHRGYKKGSGVEAGILPEKVHLPGCFPDGQAVRSDIADYYLEVQQYDEQIGELLTQLEELDELENTLIVVTSDNGMPFPRAKSNLYDLGTRVPLTIWWGSKLSPQIIEDFVSLTDLAPTFLSAAGQNIPEQMTGENLLTLIMPDAEKTSSKDRSHIFFGKERHVPGQELGDWGGYPSRAVRNHDFLYIKNFRPDRWPAGTPNYQKASFYPAYYSDVDGGPTRTYMIANQDKDEQHRQLFSLAFEQRSEIELYDLNNDPDQLVNIAEDPNYEQQKAELDKLLMDELRNTNDHRAIGGEEAYESYPYTGGSPFPDNFKRSGRHYATFRIDDFESKYISARPIEVLVPVNHSYGERFPVIYMFDGQNIFHSFKGWGREENAGWQVDEVLDSLYRADSIGQAIVVGIFNVGESRMSDYMPAKPEALVKARIDTTTHEWEQSFKKYPPRSDEQLSFLVEELKPYIDSNFHTVPDREHTFVAGSSMGGLISAYAICEYPDVFGGAACFSTHWPILDGVFVEYLKQNLPEPDTHKLYFDHGTVGLDSLYAPFQQLADEALRAKGYMENQNWITKEFVGAKHHEDDWRARLHIPLEFLLKDLE